MVSNFALARAFVIAPTLKLKYQGIINLYGYKVILTYIILWVILVQWLWVTTVFKTLQRFFWLP